jgi:hypothetical protein
MNIKPAMNGTNASSPRNPLHVSLSYVLKTAINPMMQNIAMAQNMPTILERGILGVSVSFVTLRLPPQRLQ